MNTKRFIICFIVIFVILEITNYLVHGIILGPTYADDAVNFLYRSSEEMMSKMWIMYIMDLIWSFFFVLIFVKGYENKGILEGLRYGLYIGIFYVMVQSYNSYVIYPIPYLLAFLSFVYGIIQVLILGVVASLIYKPKEAVE